jgi:RNA polymerase sigma-70 factor (ECF subfamily)
MRNYSNDKRVSEELAHEVFVEAYLNLASFKRNAPFRHWLARIATFTGYDYWRSLKRRKNEMEFSEERDGRADEAAPPGDPEKAREFLYDMLAALADRDRLILTLVYLEECPRDEVAERLGIDREKTAMRIFKAKKKLKRMLEKGPWKGRLKWMTSR